jgi:galactonate dehydratase
MSSSGRRIEAVETILADGGWHNYVFVVVTTEDGLTGLGEATLEYHEAIVAQAVARYGEVVRGMDAGRIEQIWQRLYRGGFWRGGPVLMSALSGIDQALWDLKGKAAGMPVYELLGGRCRDHLVLYGRPRGEEPAAAATDAERLVDLGYRRLKVAAFGPTRDVDTDSTIQKTVQLVAEIRARVGPEVALAVDAHGRFSPAMTIKLARALEPHGIWFLEEPALPEDPLGTAQVARATTIPIATGERLYSRWEFRPVLDAGGVAMVQPDLSHCGGISEGRRIAAMAETYRAGFAPHNPMSPVNTVVSAHVALATPNFVALEYLNDDVEWRDALLTRPLDVRDGILRLSDAPGLGIELDRETCRAHPPRPETRNEYTHDDGAVAEW